MLGEEDEEAAGQEVVDEEAVDFLVDADEAEVPSCWVDDENEDEVVLFVFDEVVGSLADDEDADLLADGEETTVLLLVDDEERV